MRKITIAANWKMYLDESGSIDFIEKLNAESDLFSNRDIILFPSHACIRSVKNYLKSDIKIGMQDCDMHEQGAYTGSTSINAIDAVLNANKIFGLPSKLDGITLSSINGTVFPLESTLVRTTIFQGQTLFTEPIKNPVKTAIVKSL